jgi:3-isopropylmalate dehydrogenase
MIKSTTQEIRERFDNKSLAKGMVTEDLSSKNKAYKTSEVGDWLAENI